MTVAEFFQTMIFVLMGTAFITLAIIFLQLLHGSDEKTG